MNISSSGENIRSSGVNIRSSGVDIRSSGVDIRSSDVVFPRISCVLRKIYFKNIVQARNTPYLYGPRYSLCH